MRTMTCQHPTCYDDASDTYHDEHRNGLRLCEKHYYRAVTGQVTSTNVTVDATSPVTSTTNRPLDQQNNLMTSQGRLGTGLDSSQG